MTKRTLGFLTAFTILFAGCTPGRSQFGNIDDTDCNASSLTSNSSRTSISAGCTIPNPILNTGTTGTSGTTGTTGTSGTSATTINNAGTLPNAPGTNGQGVPADLLGSLLGASNYGFGQGVSPFSFGGNGINDPSLLQQFLDSPTFGPMLHTLFGDNIPPNAIALLQQEIALGHLINPKIRLRIMAAGSRSTGQVKIYRMSDTRQPIEIQSFYAFETTGVNVALGDVTGDGIIDLVVSRATTAPEVRIFRGVMSGESGLSFVFSGFFNAYPGFAGGVHIAVGDFDGDGKIDIATGAGEGGGPHVKAWKGPDFVNTTHSFFAYDSGFRGGVRVAFGDFNGDHHADLVTAPGPGGGPHVKAFRGVNTPSNNPTLIENYWAYDPAFVGGVHVACADMNNDGITDLVTGAGKGGGPHAKFFNGRSDKEMYGQFVYDQNTFRDGVEVAAGYIFGDRNPALVVAPATPNVQPIIGYSWTPGQTLKEEFRVDPFNNQGYSIAVGVTF